MRSLFIPPRLARVPAKTGYGWYRGTEGILARPIQHLYSPTSRLYNQPCDRLLSSQTFDSGLLTGPPTGPLHHKMPSRPLRRHWLFRVARNRITDLFRKKKPQQLDMEELLPSAEAGPDAEYARTVLLEELEAALEELPEDQRHVFIAHEIEGRSFKELAEVTGVSVNTLLSRKHYAVLHLRKRLRSIYKEFRSQHD